jgi:hypothetical protein
MAATDLSASRKEGTHPSRSSTLPQSCAYPQHKSPGRPQVTATKTAFEQQQHRHKGSFERPACFSGKRLHKTMLCSTVRCQDVHTTAHAHQPHPCMPRVSRVQYRCPTTVHTPAQQHCQPFTVTYTHCMLLPGLFVHNCPAEHQLEAAASMMCTWQASRLCSCYARRQPQGCAACCCLYSVLVAAWLPHPARLSQQAL